jgi:suppressor of G2 allele of SKP1
MSIQDASDVFAAANSLFVDEDYTAARKKYSEAIELDDKNAEFYAKRAACAIKLADYPAALSDADSALRINPKHAAAMQRKGIALFQLDKLTEARLALKESFSLDGSAQTNTWIGKVEAECHKRGLMASSDNANGTASASSSSSSSTAAAAPPVRWEWFQSASNVTIEVFMKNVAQQDVKVDATASSIDIEIRVPGTNKTWEHHHDLYANIEKDKVRVRVLSTKVEITLPKVAKDVMWDELDAKPELASVKVPPASIASATDAPTAAHSYPSSSKKKVDWSRVEKDVEQESKDEKLTGDAGLMKLFRDIYSNADEDTRRAMVKSYQESGGTVLSTNWSEVGKAPVKCEPPKGMEAHKWNE